MPFPDLVRSVVGESADIVALAQKCCEECGMPAGCNCIKDIIGNPDAWTQWPVAKVTRILTEAKHSH